MSCIMQIKRQTICIQPIKQNDGVCSLGIYPPSYIQYAIYFVRYNKNRESKTIDSDCKKNEPDSQLQYLRLAYMPAIDKLNILF